MLKNTISVIAVLLFCTGHGQEDWGRKFEQLGTMLPTPNTTRNASGAPGKDYWQQKADYKIDIVLDDQDQSISGKETIIYHNQSPDDLEYLWLQLEQNAREKDSDLEMTRSWEYKDSLEAHRLLEFVDDHDGGFKILSVTDAGNQDLPYTINKTMMRINLKEPLKSGEKISFNIDFSYNINDRMKDEYRGELGRSGYEYFPEDGNYSYTIAQFYPRMAVYDDVEGWQNKQFLGDGEFALPFGDFEVSITVPSDFIVGATGELDNAQEVLTEEQYSRFQKSKETFDDPVLIVTEKEAIKNEKSRSEDSKTWVFKADDVRDFAFAASRKYIWDALAVKLENGTSLAMSFFPKEGNPLWEEYSTRAVAHTLEVYSKYTIDYPYPVAISVHAASVGMEYPMICFNFGRPEPDGSYTESLKYRMIGVIIHEVGHNFFPMIINSDERQWTWMDEGLNSFVQYLAQKEWSDDFPHRRGPAKDIVPYMRGDKGLSRPIMTNSEQLLQFGNNAYAKPATALNILREVVMGPELFDYAFKKYSERWAFKHPSPADFFRTMEDASAVDLDWFWRGWFYTTDYVDVSLDNVKWFRMMTEEEGLETRNVKVRDQDLGGGVKEFAEEAETFVFKNSETKGFKEFKNNLDNEQVKQALEGKNFYELTFTNQGGLVSPIIIEWIYDDGTKELEKLPAEIWRRNEKEVKKVFIKEKQVVNINVDPFEMTADVEVENNVFPRQEGTSRFDKFKKGN